MFLFFGRLVAIEAQPAPAISTNAGAMSSYDVIVLLDSSQSVLPWFEEACDYVVGPIVRDYLRKGDVFHLLSFGESAKVEIAQGIENERDIASILGRLYLLYPFERRTDLIGAFAYLHQYLRDLPESRPKVIFVLTDGAHDPAPGSSSFGIEESSAIAMVEATSALIKRNGWPIHIVRLPFSAERAAVEKGSFPEPLSGKTGALQTQTQLAPTTQASGSIAPASASVVSSSTIARPSSSGGGRGSSASTSEKESAEGGLGLKAESSIPTSPNANDPVQQTLATQESSRSPASREPNARSITANSDQIPSTEPRKGSESIAGAKTTPSPTAILDAAAQGLGATVTDYSSHGKEEIAEKSMGIPIVEFPETLGKKGYSFSFALRVRNPSSNELALELSELQVDGFNALGKKSFLRLDPGESGSITVFVSLPTTLEPGIKRMSFAPRFADGIRASPPSANLSFELAPSPFALVLRSGANVVLFALGLVVTLGAFAAVLFYWHRMRSGSSAPVIDAVRRSSASTAAATDAGNSAYASEAIQTMAPSDLASDAEKSNSKGRRPEADAASSIDTPSSAWSSSGSGTSLGIVAASADGSVAKSKTRVAMGDIGAPKIEPLAANVRPALGLDGTRAGAASHIETFATTANAPKAPIVSDEKAKEKSTVISATRVGTEAIGDISHDRDRGLYSSPAEAEGPRKLAAYIPRVASQKAEIRIELHVADQNTHIGLRNVHQLGTGASKSVGGGRSDFFVFLVPVPQRAADLHFDGERLIFVPLIPELFPTLDGPVEDCLGKEIAMVSRRGYPLSLRFERYQPPADKINRLLHCIEIPGIFTFDC